MTTTVEASEIWTLGTLAKMTGEPLWKLRRILDRLQPPLQRARPGSATGLARGS